MSAPDLVLQKLIHVLFPLIGTGLLLGAGISSASTWQFIHTAARAEGRVVRLSAGGAHPVIQFEPVGTTALEFSTSGFVNYAVGDKVTVLYLQDTQSPRGFQTAIDSPGALWFVPGLMTALGGAFVVGGLQAKRLA